MKRITQCQQLRNTMAASTSYAGMVASNSVSKFNEYLQLSFPQDSKRTRSGIIHREFANGRIVSHLKGRSDPDKHFRHMVKKNQFQLLDLPEAGIKDALVVRVKVSHVCEVSSHS